jgi:hypothetical protein
MAAEEDDRSASAVFCACQLLFHSHQLREALLRDDPRVELLLPGGRAVDMKFRLARYFGLLCSPSGVAASAFARTTLPLACPDMCGLGPEVRLLPAVRVSDLLNRFLALLMAQTPSGATTLVKELLSHPDAHWASELPALLEDAAGSVWDQFG